MPEPSKLVPVRSMLKSPWSPSYFFTTSLEHSEDVATQMAIVYVTKGKGVASDASVNHSSPILMAKHIRFTYSNDVDDAVSSLEENPEEDPSEEFATTGSPLNSTGSSQSEEF